jgi:hypothetical protein
MSDRRPLPGRDGPTTGWSPRVVGPGGSGTTWRKTPTRGTGGVVGTAVREELMVGTGRVVPNGSIVKLGVTAQRSVTRR